MENLLFCIEVLVTIVFFFFVVRYIVKENIEDAIRVAVASPVLFIMKLVSLESKLDFLLCSMYLFYFCVACIIIVVSKKKKKKQFS